MLRRYGWLISRLPSGTTQRTRAARIALTTPGNRNSLTTSRHVEDVRAEDVTERELSTLAPANISKPVKSTLGRTCISAPAAGSRDGDVEPGTKRKTRKIPGTSQQVNAAPKRGRRRLEAAPLPARLMAAGPAKHDDLHSFLAYVDRTNLSIKSSVYKGTHFEYTVAEALKAYNFTLQRTGRANDLGIDLLGHWMLPGRPKGSPLPVLLQCKASKSAKPSPAWVRELEGAYRGAPSGWRHDNGVLALLVTTQPTTQGVSAAIQRSESPMGVLQVTSDGGEVKQFVWNAAASRAGLEGLGVAIKYYESEWVTKVSDEKAEGSVRWCLGLTWLGKVRLPCEKSAHIDLKKI